MSIFFSSTPVRTAAQYSVLYSRNFVSFYSFLFTYTYSDIVYKFVFPTFYLILAFSSSSDSHSIVLNFQINTFYCLFENNNSVVFCSFSDHQRLSYTYASICNQWAMTNIYNMVKCAAGVGDSSSYVLVYDDG